MTLDEFTQLARAIDGTRPDRSPIRHTFVLTGRWRVYFNRHGAAPLVWCIAPVPHGDRAAWEVAVHEVTLNAPAVTVHAPKSTPDHEDGRPSAWIEVDGLLTVYDDGRATIEAAA